MVYVHGVRFMVHGEWFMVYGLWFRVYGLWFMVYGPWSMVHGLRFMGPTRDTLLPEAAKAPSALAESLFIKYLEDNKTNDVRLFFRLPPRVT